MEGLLKFCDFCWWSHTSCRLAARMYARELFRNSADLSSIVATQFIGTPLYWINRDLYYAYMALTKQSFGIFVTTLTQWWAPTAVRISGDASVAGQLKRTEDGRVELHFPGRVVLIANHQVWGKKPLCSLDGANSCRYIRTGFTSGGPPTQTFPKCTAISTSSLNNP